MMNRFGCGKRWQTAMAFLCLVCMIVQGRDIATHLNNNSAGQVNVTAPAGLATREVNKAKDDSKNVENQSEIDDSKDKDKDNETETTEKKDLNNQHRSNSFIANRSVGFRVQAFSDNNYRNAKQNAQARARIIAAKFPNYRTYLTYKAPTWRLRVGDFRSKEDAQRALTALRNAFPSYAGEFSIVRDKINVWGYGK